MKVYNVDSIQEHLIFKCIAGSKAYGLDTATSDTDIRGVYVLPQDEILGINYQDQVNDTTNDTVYYELGKFINLLCKANPNVLEFLNIKDELVLKTTPLFESIRKDSKLFLTKQCNISFGGYAIAQIKKARGLNKKVFTPMSKTKKGLLDFCYISTLNGTVPFNEWIMRQRNMCKQSQYGASKVPNAKNLYYIYPDLYKDNLKGLLNKDKTSTTIKLSSIPKSLSVHQIVMIYDEDSYKYYCKKYKEYWDWVALRNPDRYNNTIKSGKGYDAKNIMHCMRLLRTCKELAQTGVLNVFREDREELLKIRSGSKDFDRLLNEAEGIIKELDGLYDKCDLNDPMTQDEANEYLISKRKEYYKIKSI